jgi:hypothetical protein
MSTPESDPTGRQPNTPGAKLDAGKAPVLRGVIQYFPRALMAVSEVSAHGAAKYTWKGWEDVPDGIERYGDALARHLVKEAMGPLDEDSGFLHAAHAAWNALLRLELILRAQEEQTASQQTKQVDNEKTEQSPVEMKDERLRPSCAFRKLVERVRKLNNEAADYMLGEGRCPLPHENRRVEYIWKWCQLGKTVQGSDFWIDIHNKLEKMEVKP